MPQADARSSTSTPAKILVIEDERPISIALVDLLETCGCQVLSASSAEEGVRLLGKNPLTDIILLDYNLGSGMTGLEAIPKILEKSRHLQIVMLTSIEDVHVGVDCIKAGAFDYLTKPLDENRFLELIPRALEKKKLSQLNQLYLGILAHDLHNPLSSLKMGWGFFSDASDQLSLNDKHRSVLSAMEASIWEIKNTIDNIISVSKFEQGHLSASRSSFLLYEAISSDLSVLNGVTHLANKAIEIQFNLNDDFELFADREFFKQILLNLVNNSLRYCPEGQKVTVKVEKTGPDITISVSNPGSFIEEPLRQEVFEKYFHGNFSTPYEGNKNFGLGLTYSRLAVEAMGGKIWIESQKDPMRTTFYFSVANGGPPQKN